MTEAKFYFSDDEDDEDDDDGNNEDADDHDDHDVDDDEDDHDDDDGEGEDQDDHDDGNGGVSISCFCFFWIHTIPSPICNIISPPKNKGSTLFSNIKGFSSSLSFPSKWHSF